MRFRILIVCVLLGVMSTASYGQQKKHKPAETKAVSVPVKIKGLLDILKYDEKQEPAECEITFFMRIDPRKIGKNVNWSELESGAVLVTGDLSVDAHNEPQLDVKSLQKLPENE